MIKSIMLSLAILLSLTMSTSHAGGGMTHMYIAESALAHLSDARLRHLLQDHMDAYLVGAYYPDTGCIFNGEFCEDSHWDEFIYTFAKLIKEKYPDPVQQHPALVAFLFGCAVHRVSDQIIHWTFYPVSSRMDFHNDYNAAHQYGDTGIDLLINIDKNQWLTHPKTWWVPVQDIVEVYHRMGKNHTAAQIIFANSLLYLAGYAERSISLAAYPFLKWKMPWTAAHYMDAPEGGIAMDKVKVAAYQMTLWEFMNHGTTPQMSVHIPSAPAEKNAGVNVAQTALQSGIVTINAHTHADGSVTLEEPVIHHYAQLQQLIATAFHQFTH